MTPQAVEVLSLQHSFGTRQALQGVSFSVAPGQVYALVGPNGGGKSTTFRVLATLLKPDGGEVRIFGEDAVKSPARVRSRLGVIFQNPALDKKLSVEENLRFHGHLYGLRGADLRERVRRQLAAFGLEERAADRTENLSGGMRRRVELAKGLLSEPELLLLDEPTTGLDPAARRQFWELLSEQRGKVTLLVATHLLDEAERADRVGFLDGGRLVAEGSPRELRESLGGEILSIRSPSPRELSRQLEERFSLRPALVGSEIRVEREKAHELVGTLLESFSALIESVTVGKPTLEDFFIAKTGTPYRRGEST